MYRDSQDMPLIINMLLLFSIIGIIYFVIKDMERQKIIVENGKLRVSLMKDEESTRELLKKLRNIHSNKTNSLYIELDGNDYSVRSIG